MKSRLAPFNGAPHRGKILASDISPDGRTAVSLDTDGTVAVWDLEQGICLRHREHAKAPTLARFVSSGTLVLAWPGGSYVPWRLSLSSLELGALGEASGLPGEVLTALDVSATNGRIVLVSDEYANASVDYHVARVWVLPPDLERAGEPWLLVDDDRGWRCVAALGEDLVALGSRGISVWDERKEMVYTHVPDSDEALGWLRVLADQTVIAAYMDGALCVWEPGQKKPAVERKVSRWWPLAISDKLVALPDAQGRLTVSHLRTGTLVDRIELPSPPSALVFAGERDLLIGLENGGLLTWQR